MKYVIDSNERPFYMQIYRLIREDIINGVYRFGFKLPSKRLLAEDTGLSSITVKHAYELLCDEGYVRAKERSGYYVVFSKNENFEVGRKTETVKQALVSSTKKYPEFSTAQFCKTTRRVLSEYCEIILETSPNTGRRELKSAIKRYLERNRGLRISDEQIVIGSGSEYLYGLITELLGRNKIYAIEAPSYKKIELVYRANEVRLEMLPLSSDGIESKALLKTKADVLHTTPYRSFPSGATATASKRHEYIRWASAKGRYIIEDDYESEFAVNSKPTETLFSLSKQDNVIYMNTFSLTISPSLRASYMVLPQKLAATFEEKLGFYSCTVPTFEQLILAELMDEGDFERHINRVRRIKRKALENSN